MCQFPLRFCFIGFGCARLVGKQLVAAVHPGWVRTNIAKRNIHGRLLPAESAQKIVEFITSDFKSGIFWNVETEAECRW